MTTYLTAIQDYPKTNFIANAWKTVHFLSNLCYDFESFCLFFYFYTMAANNLIYPVDSLDQSWVALLRSTEMDVLNDAAIEMLADAGYWSLYRLDNIRDTKQVTELFKRLGHEALKAVPTIPTGMVAAAAVPAVVAPPVGAITRAAAAAATAAAAAAAAAALQAQIQPIPAAQVVDVRPKPRFSDVAAQRFCVLVSWFQRMERLGIVPYAHSFTLATFQESNSLFYQELDLALHPPVPGARPPALVNVVKFLSWKNDFTTYVESIYGAAKIPLSYVYREDVTESAEDLAADNYPTMELRLMARTLLSGDHYVTDNRSLSRLLNQFVQAPTILPHVVTHLRAQDGRAAMIALQAASLGSNSLEARYGATNILLRGLTYSGTGKVSFDSFVTKFLGLTNDCALFKHKKQPHDMVSDFMACITDKELESAAHHINRNPEIRKSFEAVLKVYQETDIQNRLNQKKSPASNVSAVESGKRKRSNGKGAGKKGTIPSKRKSHSVGPPWTLPITAGKYEKEEWIRMTEIQQAEVKAYRTKNGIGKKGGAGGAAARAISAVTTQPTTTIYETDSNHAPTKKKRKVGPARTRRNDLRTAAHHARNAPPIEPIVSVVSTAAAMDDDDDAPLFGPAATADVTSTVGLQDTTEAELEDFDDLEISDDELVAMQPGQPAARFACAVRTPSLVPPVVAAPCVPPRAVSELVAPLPKLDMINTHAPAIDLFQPPLPGYDPPGIDAKGFKYPSRPEQWSPDGHRMPPNHNWGGKETLFGLRVRGEQLDGKIKIGRGFDNEPIWAMHRDGTLWASPGTDNWKEIHGPNALAAKAKAALELEGPPQKATAAEIAAFDLIKATYLTKPDHRTEPAFGRRSKVRPHTLKSSSDQST